MDIISDQLELVFQSPYKSIKELKSVVLPNFVVVTGPNGSGKTQFLEAIHKNSIDVFGADKVKIQPLRMMYMPAGEVHPIDNVMHNATTHRSHHWQMATRLQDEVLTNVRRSAVQGTLSNQGVSPQILQQILERPLHEQKKLIDDSLPKESQEQIAAHLRAHLPHVEERAKQFWNDPRNMALTRTVIDELQESIFFVQTADLSDQLDRVSISSSSLFFDLAVVISTYHRERELNEYKKFRAKRSKNKSKKWLTDEEFTTKYGPEPWTLINTLLDRMKLDLRVSVPENDKDDPYRLAFRKGNVPIPMMPSDLSGGERLIIAVATALYGSQSGSGPRLFPKLLLFDELDAPLHPSLTKGLMDALHTIIQQTNCMCILTTHSPSTVALAPEKSVYEISASPREVRAITREIGVHLLTNGLLTVTENTRLVFTEAKADSDLYQGVYNFLASKGEIKTVPNLIFLPVSDEKDEKGGGKDQVKQWVQKLSNSPTIAVRGIIDKDKDNVSEGNVFITSRYSLENYLLDPLLVVGTMLGGLIKPPFITVQIERLEPAAVRQMSTPEKQKIADEFCAFIETKRSQLSIDHPGKFDVHYSDGTKLRLPNWLRDCRGHDLVKIYKAAIHPNLMHENIFAGTFSKLTTTLTQVLPELIPVELSKLILKNQS